MKVLHVIQKNQLRGAEVFACQMSDQMNRKGNTAVIATLFEGGAELPTEARVRPLNRPTNKRGFDVKGWKMLAQLIKEENPDIVQANAGDTLKYTTCSKLFFRWKQPIVFRNASTISLYIKSTPAKLVNKFFLKQVSYIASVSEISKNDFLNLFPSFDDRIRTLPVGVNPSALDDKKPNVQPVIIHVGGFTYEKNHEGLINIFKKVLIKHPQAKLWLVGDGPTRIEIEKIVKQNGLVEHVTFYGFRHDALNLIRQADVLVLPSIIEGLPGVILEAFYCSTPVVAYDVGGVKEIVKEDTGDLIPLHDIDRFADSISAIIENPEKNSGKIEMALKLVTEEYLNNVIADKFLDVYKTVCSLNKKLY